MSLKTILILIGIVIIGLALIYAPKAIRVNKMIHLYDKDKIAYNFINMDKIFRAGPTIKASASPHSFQNMTNEFSLPPTFKHLGEDENLEDALEYYETDGLIVLKNNNLLYENYWHNNTQTSKHISWSVAKSFLSALIGIALLSMAIFSNSSTLALRLAITSSFSFRTVNSSALVICVVLFFILLLITTLSL